MDEILKHAPLTAEIESQLQQAASGLPAAVAGALARYWELVEAIQSLETAGICNAHPWWKDGEYLYLVYPTDATGYRRRVYVGSKPEKVQEAEASMQRYRKHRELVHEADQLKRRLMEFCYSFRSHLATLSQYKPENLPGQPSLLGDTYNEPALFRPHLTLAEMFTRDARAQETAARLVAAGTQQPTLGGL